MNCSRVFSRESMGRGRLRDRTGVVSLCLAIHVLLSYYSSLLRVRAKFTLPKKKSMEPKCLFQTH